MRWAQFFNPQVGIGLKYRGPLLRVSSPALGSDDSSLDQSATSIQILLWSLDTFLIKSAQNQGGGGSCPTCLFSVYGPGRWYWRGGTLDAAVRLIKVQLTKIRKIVISRPAGLFWGLKIKWSIRYIDGFVIAFLSALIQIYFQKASR